MSVTLVNPYCTLADAQAEADNVDPTDADTIASAINLASRMIDRICRRDFLWHDYSQTPLEIPKSWIALENIHIPWPVINVTSIIEIDGSGYTQTMLPADWRVESEFNATRGRIVRNGRWLELASYEQDGLVPQRTFKFRRRFQVYGQFGYAPAATNPSSTPSPDIPADIQAACAVIAAVRSGKLRKEVTGFDGSKQAFAVKKIPQDTLDILARYTNRLT